MKSYVKYASIMFSTALVGAALVQSGFAVKEAHAATLTDQTQVSQKGFSSNTDDNLFNSGVPIIITNNHDEELTPSQRFQVNQLIEKIGDFAEANSSSFEDPAIGQQIVANTQMRGKAGLAAKAGAKILKAALKKMGKKGFDKMATWTGMKAVGINWGVINKIADVFAGFGGTVESALKKAFKSIGFNSYWAGVAARAVSIAFF